MSHALMAYSLPLIISAQRGPARGEGKQTGSDMLPRIMPSSTLSATLFPASRERPLSSQFDCLTFSAEADAESQIGWKLMVGSPRIHSLLHHREARQHVQPEHVLTEK
jgi:hypothetical protein